MKIIVDQMPRSCKECLYGDIECDLNDAISMLFLAGETKLQYVCKFDTRNCDLSQEEQESDCPKRECRYIVELDEYMNRTAMSTYER